MIHRLVLGTAQFQGQYGIARSPIELNLSEIRELVSYAYCADIKTLDTAISYGRCETLLGTIGVDQWQIISKLPAVPSGILDVDSWTRKHIYTSLERLGITSFYGLLLHNPLQLNETLGEDLFSTLEGLRHDGVVERIGISIYSPQEFQSLFPKYSFDIVQAPLNLIDRRLITSGLLSQLYHSGVEVHIRSVFLQGLLLMDQTSRTKSFSRWNTLWKELDHWLKSDDIHPLHACLAFVLSHDEVSAVIIGVDNRAQLQEIIESGDLSEISPPSSIASEDLDLIDPRRWDF